MVKVNYFELLRIFANAHSSADATAFRPFANGAKAAKGAFLNMVDLG